MTQMTRCVLQLGVIEVTKDGSTSASPPTAQNYVILLRLLDLEYKENVKGKFHPKTGHESPEGSRVTAVLFP
jgi:hypothetical protein